MRTLISTRLDLDFTVDEINTMIKTNPARLLDLDQE